MAKTYVQPGNVLDYVNGGGTTVTSGSVVVLGALVGIALCDIAAGDTGSVAVSGVWALPLKASTALAAGADASWVAADTEVADSGGISAGTVVTAAASGDATVEVLLNNNSNGTH